MPQRILSEDEFNAVKEKVLSALPANLSEADFNRVVPSMMAGAVAEAENSPEPVTGGAAGRFLSGAGEMLNPLTAISGVAQTIAHPIETGKAVLGRMGEEWEKAGHAASEGRYTEAAARAAAGSVPIVGPMIADIGEQAGRGDLAGAAGKLTGLAVPFAAEKALGARAASRAGAKAPVLEQQAVDQVAQRVLGPGNPAYRGRAQAIAPEVLARKMSGGRDELRQAAMEGMEDAANRIDDAINAAGGVKAQIPVQEVEAGLRARIADLKDSTGVPLSDQAAKRIKALEQRIVQVRALGGRKGTASFEDLRKIRDENYRIASDARGYERAGNQAMADEGWAARESGGVIRDVFARRSPQTAAANADYTFFKTLNDILDPALGRPKSLTPSAGVTGGTRTVGAVVGNMVGPKAALVMSVVVPWIRERLTDASWQMADAQSKMKLAQAMKRGDIGRMQSLMLQIQKAAPKPGMLGPTSPSEPQTAVGLPR